MKKIEIRKFTKGETIAEGGDLAHIGTLTPNYTIIRAEGEELSVYDGFHTMDELYAHRIALYINLAQQTHALNTVTPRLEKLHRKVWRSRLHSDGTSYDGYFILGIGTRKGEQITYHLSNEYWDNCHFAEELEKAPEFDGHTSNDVLKRLGL